MVLARPESPSSSRGGIIQSQGAVFEGDSGHKYALAIEDVVEKTSSALETCEPDVSVWSCGMLTAGRGAVHADSNEEARADHHSR